MLPFLRSLPSFPRAPVALAAGLALAALAGLGFACVPDPVEWVEFPWREDEPDVRNERLCAEAADPDGAADTTFIDCALEGASFAPDDADPPGGREIVVVAWNVERGFESAAQIEALLHDPALPVPDVLLLSEVDRGCRRTGYRNVAREFARALGFTYVFATEFVELPSDRDVHGPYDPPLCEHGNAIVSRWPLGNVRQVRHASQTSWYTPPGHPDPDEPRLGGRVAVVADVRVGDRLVRVHSLHLESAVPETWRGPQAAEIAQEAQGLDIPVVVGGDLNAFFEVFTLYGDAERHDAAVAPFLDAGFADAHAGIPVEERTTATDVIPLVIDYVFTRGAAVVDAGVCPEAVCGGLSDHLAVWARLRLPPAVPSADGDLDDDGRVTAADVRTVAECRGPTAEASWACVRADLDENGVIDDRDVALAGAQLGSLVCNGSPWLCERGYDEVAYATSHNAFATIAEVYFPASNQTGTMSDQLERGVRGLMLDTWYFDADGDGASDGPHLCHTLPFCGLPTPKTLTAGLVEIREFVEAHRGEVVTLIFESYVSADDTAAAFEAAGLLDPERPEQDLLYVHEEGAPWPTLGELVETGQRVVVLTDDRPTPEEAARHPWHHYLWDSRAFETPFSLAPEDFPVPGFTCDFLRGSPENDLFILNHFLTRGVGQPGLAALVNPSAVLLPRAEECRAFHGRIPNFVTVDYVEIGDVFDVVDALNGL